LSGIAIVLLLLALGALQVATVRRAESYGSDSSIYIVLASNLLNGRGYSFNYEVHTTYPPGLPVLLAGISALTGESGYNLFVYSMPIFSTLGLIVWYFVLKAWSGHKTAAICCLLTATADPLYRLVTRFVVSDTPYLLVSGLALLCILGLMWAGPGSRHIRYGLLAGSSLFAILSVLLRSAGVSLCAALAAWALTEMLLRRRGREFAFSAALCAAALGLCAFGVWAGWAKRMEVKAYPGQQFTSYASLFMAADPQRPELGEISAGHLVPRLLSNIPIQASHIGGLAVRAPWVMPAWHSPLAVIVLALLACGLLSCAACPKAALLAWYFLAYFSVYLLWPFNEGPRFMLPAAPLAFVLLWRGAHQLSDLVCARPATTWAAVLLVSLLLTASAAGARGTGGLQGLVALAFWPSLAAVAAFFLWRSRVRRAAGPEGRAGRPAGFLLGARAVVLGVLGLALTGVVQSAQSARENLNPDPTTFLHYPATDASAWIRGAKQGKVMAQQSAIVHRLTGRRVVVFPATTDPRIIVTLLEREMVRYLVVSDQVKDEYILPSEEERFRLIELAYPNRLRLVHRGPGYRIFECDLPSD
jgi:hypothetical protein